jgi:hypothetical protein
MPQPNPSAQHGDEIQEAFAKEASALDLRLEDPDLVIGQPIGALVSCIAGAPLVTVKPPRNPPVTPSFDAVRDVVVAWETFDPDKILETWDRYAAQPTTMVVTANFIGAVDRKMIEEGIQTAEYRKHREKYPSFSPRKVTIENLQIVFVGAAQAAATYRFEEKFKNGEELATNALMVLMMNDQKEWKIGLYSKHI